MASTCTAATGVATTCTAAAAGEAFASFFAFFSASFATFISAAVGSVSIRLSALSIFFSSAGYLMAHDSPLGCAGSYGRLMSFRSVSIAVFADPFVLATRASFVALTILARGSPHFFPSSDGSVSAFGVLTSFVFGSARPWPILVLPCCSP